MNTTGPIRSRRKGKGRVAVSLVALLAITTTLAACGGDDDDAGASASPTTAAASGAATTAGSTATSAAAVTPTTELSLDLGKAVSFDNPKNADSDVKIVYGFQTAEYPYLLKASGLFDDVPFKLDLPVLPGPQAQIAALYSGNTDAGLVGDNTAAFEWANSDEDWSVPGSEPAIYNIAGATSPNLPYPSGLFVRTDKGIDTIADLKGHSVGYNFGGNIYSSYVSALSKGDLTEQDVESIRFDSNPLAATAFVSGDLDAVVTSTTLVKTLLDSGQAKLIATHDELGVPGGSGFVSSPRVLDNPAKLAALKDFFARFTRFYSEWVPNNEAAFVKIQTTVNKQTPEIAKMNWENLKENRLYRVGDPEFIAKEQRIVDLAAEIGSVKHQRDVTNAYNPVFDDIVDPKG